MNDIIFKLNSLEKLIGHTPLVEISFIYKEKKVECDFNISKKLYGKITEFPVQIRSQISLKFETTNNYTIISDLYDIVKKFIQFLCYRKNITIEEIIKKALIELSK